MSGLKDVSFINAPRVPNTLIDACKQYDEKKRTVWLNTHFPEETTKAVRAQTEARNNVSH
jgi:hypothetical protein